MLLRQRGTINLFWLAIFCAAFAGLAMAALFSMRYERNLFAELWDKVAATAGVAPTRPLAGGARPHGDAAAPPAQATGVLKKCVIKGKTVISDVECSASNSSTRSIKFSDSAGITPVTPAPKADPTPKSNPALDKIIDNQNN